MPIAIEGGRIPTLLKRANALQPIAAGVSSDLGSNSLRIALINNMPDAALEDTELQFLELLAAAALNTPVSLKLFSLPNLPRTDFGESHLRNFYFSIKDLLNDRFDGAIITGTEPRCPNLHEEPYWRPLVQVLDWAEINTSSSVLSCLAAHAGVLASDGIPRNPLGDKQFGVFEYQKKSSHALTCGIGDAMWIPHSRWNEVKAESLAANGYEILTQSASAGVDLFTKEKKKSLFVHFQGHPEYNTRTLLKEYRRDIKRFLRKERETFPSSPHNYFDAAATERLSGFQKNAMIDPREEVFAAFPEAAVALGIRNSWSDSAAVVYRNWLKYLTSKKTENRSFVAMTPVTRA